MYLCTQKLKRIQELLPLQHSNIVVLLIDSLLNRYLKTEGHLRQETSHLGEIVPQVTMSPTTAPHVRQGSPFYLF